MATNKAANRAGTRRTNGKNTNADSPSRTHPTHADGKPANVLPINPNENAQISETRTNCIMGRPV
ncbi:MAG: hypothetical protein BWX54_02391 [Verrucomicrobia bacterium ADurb.Bin018]|nr:MAG: hypothetical protein BWX54_02391 [Verrucomicrobia bacterium ADurb.Bin018]